MVRIDRIGRRWLDTLQCIIALRARGVKIRSLDETEGWTRFLELAPDDPLAFVGHQMVSMAAWVADQEREVGRRRTREGLAARSHLGRMVVVRSGWCAKTCSRFAGASSALVAVSRSPAMASPSNVWRGAAAAKWSSSWVAGDGSGNNCALFPRKRAGQSQD